MIIVKFTLLLKEHQEKIIIVSIELIIKCLSFDSAQDDSLKVEI